MSDYRMSTNCIHAGYRPGNGEPRNIPIIQSTTFRYATGEQMGALYTRSRVSIPASRTPPTTHVAAQDLRPGGRHGGHAHLLRPGGQLLRGVQHRLLRRPRGGLLRHLRRHLQSLRRHHECGWAVEFTFVDPDCSEEELEAAFKPNTKAVFGETIANPALTVLDIEKFAKAAHAHGVPLIVDNTFPTPVNCRPFEWGRRHRHPLHHQVHGRPRQRGGRRHCGLGQVRLDGPRRQVPRPDHPRRELPRHHLRREVRQGGRLHHQGHRPAHAGLRLHPLSPELLLPEHRPGDPASADEAALLQTLWPWPSISRATRRWHGSSTPAWRGTSTTPMAAKYMPNGTCGVVSFGVKGGRAGGLQIHGRAGAGLHRHSRGRRQDLRAPPRLHHPPADE